MSYALTKSRVLQYIGIILIIGVFAGAYWYFQVFAGVKTNTSLTDSLSEGLAGYWKLDEGTGTTATDSSVNGNNGTVPNSWTTGQVGGAVSFNGSTAMTVSAGTGVLDAKQNVTLAAWVYPRSVGSYQAYFYKGVSGCDEGTAKYMFELDVATKLRFWMGGSSITATVGLSNNQWQHIVATNSAAGSAIYVNGILVQSGSAMAAPASSSEDWRFNRCNSSDANMDEIRIYNRALLADEVAQLYRLNTPTGTDTSLKGYWTFDGADVSGTTATDRSGSGNTGTLTNGPTVTQGKVGQALSFDGTDDYVSIGDVSALETSVFTYSAWIIPNETSGNIIGGGGNPTPRFSLSSSALTLVNTGVETIGTSAGTISLNVWSHVAVTYDALGNYIFYINGANVGSGTNTTSFSFGTSAFTINSVGGSYLGGSFDEVRVYNRALSASEIQAQYKAGQSDEVNTGASQAQGGSRLDSGLAGYWKMDDGSGTSASDASTNANTGTLTNGPTWGTGQIGGAVDFDGSNDYIALTDSPVFDPGGTATWCLWFYNDTVVSSTGLFMQDTSSGQSFSSFKWIAAYLTSSSTVLSNYIRIGGTAYSATAPTGYFVGAWHHVCSTFDKNLPSARLKIYVNGTLAGTHDAVNGDIDAGNLPEIGAWRYNASHFNGKIDEVRMYGRTLSADEVAQLYLLNAPTGTDTGLKGYWSFNGKDVSGTTAYDRSGAGNTGTLTNGPTVTPGKIGQALSFDGTDDYVTVPSSTALNPTTAITVSAWIKRGNNGTRQFFLSKGGAAGGGDTQYWLEITSANLIVFQIASSGAGFSVTSPTTLTDTNGWHLVSGTWNGTTQKLYIDGVEVATAAASLTMQTTTDDLVLGNRSTFYNIPFNGKLDEPRIYGRALSASEIQAQYAAGQSDEVNTGASQAQGGSRLDSGLAGYWKLDDGSGTSAIDASTNGNTGTLTNGPTWTTGQIGGALTYDGTNDYVSTSKNLPSTQGTLSAWVKSTASLDPTGQYYFVTANAAGNTLQLGLNTAFGLDSWYFVMRGGFGSTLILQGPLYTSDSQIQGWHHITGTWDTSTGVRLYIDGVLAASTTSTTSAFGAFPLYIGSPSSGEYWKGDLDEVRLYDRVLSADEVGQLYRLNSPTGTDTSLKGYWSFNGKDISGTTAYDRSGAGNTGTLTNGPTVTPGKLGQALNFDGVNDNVNMGNVTSLKNSVFTYSAWINPTSLSAERNIFGGGAASTPRFSITTGGILTFLKTGVATIGVSTGTAPTVGVWTHVAVTYDVSGNYVFYINGVNAGSGTNAQTFDFTSASFGIGSDSGNMFVGKIDEVRVYNRALSAAEITSLYNASR